MKSQPLTIMLYSILCGAISIFSPLSMAGSAEKHKVLALEAELTTLNQRVNLLNAEHEVENLQRIFGFYIDKNLWLQAADLFAADGRIEIGGSGVYIGKKHILKYLALSSPQDSIAGILNDHMQLQPVITVSDDGNSAKGRWRGFSQTAKHQVDHFWALGVYENEYVKENGVWKIKSLHYYSRMKAPYDDGWAKTALPRSIPREDFPPDQAATADYENYPEFYRVPFHYANPEARAELKVKHQLGESTLAAADAVQHNGYQVSLSSLHSQMKSIEKNVERLIDIEKIERLHAVYGYYLADNQWDKLANIFAEDGTIEVALRGQYHGRKSIRKSLDIFGVPHETPGLLRNHMQMQPVIHIADDGQSAKMRSRAFSMMGNYGGPAFWMGGIYENTFVKRNGTWEIYKDQQINTYFVRYDLGWKNDTLKNPPGVSSTSPPDSPPSIQFTFYPQSFVPPFHYRNPVTGQ